MPLKTLGLRRLVRQTVFCDPQIRQVFSGSRKQFSCQPTEARGFERHSRAVGMVFAARAEFVLFGSVHSTTAGRGVVADVTAEG